jgi:catechol 2,3-dioxygenase-like lactoylglutathione lyase family enzyme
MNRIVHFEIHAGDPERAVRFYRDVFGWEIEEWSPPGAEMKDEDPKYYTSLKVIYIFTGKDLPKSKLERACELSFNEYCGVLATFKQGIPVTYEIQYIEQ